MVSVESNLLTFTGDADAALVEAMLGLPWFWSESGIPLNPGDRVELEGFQSTDHMEVIWLTNQTTGQTIQLRTAEKEGTRLSVEFDYEMPGGGLGKIAERLVVERMNDKNAETSLKNLKALFEGG